jgi:hypothetical protein
MPPTSVIPEPSPASTSKAMLWTGRVLSALAVLFLLFSAFMKFAKPPAVVEGFVHLGLPERLALAIGLVELASALLYALPVTAGLGAILLTGYLGGATLTHLRVGDPWISPVILGIIVWAGLFLRDSRVRGLIPVRRISARPRNSRDVPLASEAAGAPRR